MTNIVTTLDTAHRIIEIASLDVYLAELVVGCLASLSAPVVNLPLLVFDNRFVDTPIS